MGTKLEQQILELAKRMAGLFQSRFGLWMLGIISFAESALPLPFITDPFLVTYVLVNKAKFWSGVLVTTFSSVLGGFLAYLAGYYATDFVLSLLGESTQEEFFSLINTFQDETLLLAIVGAITPIPFTLVAVAAGVIQGNVLLFVAGTIIGRLFRYYLVAYFTRKFGEQALKVAEKNLRTTSVVIIILAVAYLFYKLI
jgi:membrane protein YqaA with SNARE-associated domain